jgi:hypothetical protein
MTVNELIQTLVSHVQAQRIRPDAEVLTTDGLDIQVQCGLVAVYIADAPAITAADSEPDGRD